MTVGEKYFKKRLERANLSIIRNILRKNIVENIIKNII